MRRKLSRRGWNENGCNQLSLSGNDSREKQKEKEKRKRKEKSQVILVLGGEEGNQKASVLELQRLRETLIFAELRESSL